MGWLGAGIIVAYFTGFILWIVSSVHTVHGVEYVDSLPIILFFALAAPLGLFLGWLVNQ